MTMRRFFLCGGANGSRHSLAVLTQGVTRSSPDAILFAGGIHAPSRRWASRAKPGSLTLDDSRYVEEFFATLGRLGVFSAIIPGPAGGPTEEFFRLGMEAELAHPDVHIAHATLVAEDGLAVCGLGGPIAEGRLLGIDSSPRPAAEYALRPLWNAKQPRKVLLLPAPPPGALGGDEGVPLVS
jgi:hypothetical protein